MNSKKRLAMLGGDLRQYTAAVMLTKRGWDVRVWGLKTAGTEKEGLSLADCPEAAMEEAEGIVLPLPVSVDGVLLNCPFDTSDTHVRLQDLLTFTQSGQKIVGGRIPESFFVQAEAKGILVHDYFLSEEFQIHNAYTTAEAAVSIAMNRLNRTLRGARVVITGYGRIGKHLSHLLRSLGAQVTVAARKKSDLAWAESFGCGALDLSREGAIHRLRTGYDVIYNTVPHWLFDRSFLEKADPDTFLIDLASVPGGVDIGAAKELGSNVLWATSLPGKYAPDSAGELIANCVDRIMREEGDV